MAARSFPNRRQPRRFVFRRPYDYTGRFSNRVSRRFAQSKTPVWSRLFDGVDDNLSVSVPTMSGAFSMFCLVRLGVSLSTGVLMQIRNSSGGAVANLNLLSNQPAINIGGVNRISALSVPQLEWIVVGVTKAAGTITPVLHSWDATTGWQHGNGSGTLNNLGTHAGGTVMFASLSGATFYEEDHMVAACWDSELSTGSIETMMTNNRTQDWIDLSPAALWEFDQTDVGQTVTDTAGYGFAQTAINGTTAITTGKTGWQYGATISRTLGLNTETDEAFPLTIVKQLPAGLTTETDEALPLTVQLATVTVNLGLVEETDSLAAFAVTLNVALGLSTETDTAQAMTLTKNISLGLATESDTAQTNTLTKNVNLGLTTETDTAQSLAPQIQVSTGLTTETDLAQAITLTKNVTLGQAQETDLAIGLTVETAAAAGAPKTLPILHVGS